MTIAFDGPAPLAKSKPQQDKRAKTAASTFTPDTGPFSCIHRLCIFAPVLLFVSGISGFPVKSIFAEGLSATYVNELALTPGCQLINELHAIADQIGDEWLCKVRRGEFVLSDSNVMVWLNALHSP